jgi:phosphoribosylformylglycinamidine cyclo-ligase
MSISKHLTDRMISLSRQTWDVSPYVYVQDGEIRRRNEYPYERYPEAVPHADGTGSKGWYCYRVGEFLTPVIDSLETNMNDLMLSGVLPYAVTPIYQFEQEDGEAILATAHFMTEQCLARRIAIVGGETETINTIQGMNIILVLRGIVFRKFKNQFLPGDVLVGLASSGLHTNGYSVVRERLPQALTQELIIPTRDYSSLFDCVEDVHGMAHITGSGFLKLRWEGRLASDVDIYLTRSHTLKPHSIFYEIYRRGVSDYEMLTTFNCGIGFVVGMQPELVERFCALARADGHKVDVIGDVRIGHGNVRIESPFSREIIHL